MFKTVMVGLLGVGVVGSAAVALSGAQATSQDATVVRIVDGDTLDVSYEGGTHRVRLLNIDTPETVHPDEPVECLGAEATEFLQDRLPRGTEILLRYDVDREDGYGRELAGVFLGEELVNAEIARAGLGSPLYVEPNDRFLGQVQEASEEAGAAGRGLYDPAVACTLPAMAQHVEQTPAAAEEASGAGMAEVTGAFMALDAWEAQLSAVEDLLDTDLPVVAVFDTPGTTDVRGHVMRLRREHQELTDFWTERRQELKQARTERRQAAEEKARQEAKEKARKAAEEAAQRKAKEQARREAEKAAQREAEEQARREAEEAARREAEEQARREAEEAARREAQEARRREADSSSGSSEPTGGGFSGTSDSTSGSRPGAGYTGCRAYPGGPYLDDQGRRYTPIDCATKAPLVP